MGEVSIRKRIEKPKSHALLPIINLGSAQAQPLRHFFHRMSSIEQLRDAMRENLDQSGVLKRVKSELRAECLRALKGEEVSPRPELSSEALCINGE